MTSSSSTTDRVLDAISRNAELTVGNKNADVADIPIKKTLTSDSISSLWSYGDIAKNAYTTVGRDSTGASVFSMDTVKIHSNQGSSTPPFLTRVGEHINSKVLSFFSAAEARVEAMCSSSPDGFDNEASHVNSTKRQQSALMDVEESSGASVKTEYEVEVPDQAQPHWSIMSVFRCSGGHQQETLDSRNDDATLDSYTIHQSLDSMEFSFIDIVQKTESLGANKSNEIEAMAAIKQQLLEHEQFLKGAPEDAKNDFYKALSRAAALNAEVAARQAELELKKIRLQSLRVQEQMDLLSVSPETFDSSVVDGSGCFPMFSTKKSSKVRKNRRGLMTAE
jgi:hypothetical protein